MKCKPHERIGYLSMYKIQNVNLQNLSDLFIDSVFVLNSISINRKTMYMKKAI